MTDQFNDPGVGGDNFPYADHLGALLLFDVTEHVANVSTKHGDKDAVSTGIAVLDGPHQGDTYSDVLVFPRVLIGQLKGSVGGKVLGRLGQRPTDKGNPAWELTTATEPDKAVARQYLAANPAPAEDPFS